MKWLQSIRSVATFLLVITACVGFIMGKVDGPSFIGMVMMVLGFYFSLKDRSASTPPDNEVTTQTTTTSTPPVDQENVPTVSQVKHLDEL